MATQHAISTISYNSKAFLLERLEVWRNSHIIQSYMVIFHKGEDGDKDHAHVRLEPNKRLDPMDLTDKLKEYTLDNAKPLGVRPWRPSKEEDWILYAVHDPDYMALKYVGDSKEKLPYKWQDIIFSDGFDMETAYIRAKAMLEHLPANLVRRIQSGDTPLKLVQQGENVFTVNAINRAVYGGDYAQLAGRFSRLEKDFETLVDSAQAFGLVTFRDDNGFLRFVPGPDCNIVPF